MWVALFYVESGFQVEKVPKMRPPRKSGQKNLRTLIVELVVVCVCVVFLFRMVHVGMLLFQIALASISIV